MRVTFKKNVDVDHATKDVLKILMERPELAYISTLQIFENEEHRQNSFRVICMYV
jgi:hypothetical protein